MVATVVLLLISEVIIGGFGRSVKMLIIKEPDTLAAWPYIWWDPDTISSGSSTYLNAGITVVTLFGYSSYSVDVRVYDNSPGENGAPQIISSSLSGCNTQPVFTYDNALKAWRFYSGICNYWGLPGTYNFGITAMWTPRASGSYVAEARVCLYEPPATGCESAYATLTVR